jgi:prepilin signal peptidase PulO-like enzyme (type II secretory pathway)
METYLGLMFFIFGSIIGSFLNVVILRYRSGRGLGGRSACFTCAKDLTWFELVPIGSFFTQRGRCAGCKAPISWQYPLVEITTGLLFVFLYWKFAYLLMGTPLLFAILFAYYAFVICLLLVMTVYDIRHKILPDGLTMLFAGVAFIGMFLIQGDAIIIHIPYAWDIIAGLVLPAPFSLMWLVSKGKWMGLGDAKLMIGIGFLLGMSAGLTALLLSFWIGAAVAIVLLLVSSLVATRGKRVSLHTAIPFGPFLVLGTLITFFLSLNFDSITQMFLR